MTSRPKFIICVFDGLRRDMITTTGMPNLRQFIDEGTDFGSIGIRLGSKGDYSPGGDCGHFWNASSTREKSMKWVKPTCPETHYELSLR